MRHPLLLPAAAVTLILTLGCLGIGGDKDVEGDEAGECSDGADNDQNGQFHCDDEGCAGSPDCDVPADTDSEDPADTDTDTDSDADADADADGDADADVEGDYLGEALVLIDGPHETSKCMGELLLEISSDGDVVGWAECHGGYDAAGGDIIGEVVGEDFHGRWLMEGTEVLGHVEVVLQGAVRDGAAELRFEDGWAEYEVVGVLYAERRD